ncbi:phenylacetate--CoA ligase family protein [Stella sp.]|uniref:phenylacetate--CoA ligase family protein n=1 Tax=Stella sp. TaxID=2912054 RepID=UPI0035B1CCE8
MTGPFFDELETRDPEARERALMAALPGQIAHARAHAAYYADALAGIDPAAVSSRAALALLPVTRKSDLIRQQRRVPPFGGLNATAPAGLARLFASPGPIYDPEGHGRDWWRFARALFAAGFRTGEILHNSFSYHLTPAGAMLESAAHALGCAVIPGGVGQTEQQVRAIADLRPDGYAGTPSFLKILLEKAAELGADVSSLTKALVSGEALPPPLRQDLADRGVAVLQCYGTADLGLVAYESPARQGMIVDEGVIVEIVRPGTGEPVPDGEPGEVVVTTFNRDYPLVRFATGDVSAILAGASPCGRTNARIKGWMGRADQTTKVRGMFVHPAQIAEVVRRHPEIERARLVVSGEAGRDRMVLECVSAMPGSALAEQVAATLQSVTKLRGAVTFATAAEAEGWSATIVDRR